MTRPRSGLVSTNLMIGLRRYLRNRSVTGLGTRSKEIPTLQERVASWIQSYLDSRRSLHRKSYYDVRAEIREQSPDIQYIEPFGTEFHPDIAIYRNGKPFVAVEVKKGKLPHQISTAIGQAFIYRTLYRESLIVVFTARQVPQHAQKTLWPLSADPVGDAIHRRLRRLGIGLIVKRFDKHRSS